MNPSRTFPLLLLAGCISGKGDGDPESVDHLPKCCSSNYGSYEPGYGFFGSTFNCQTSPVERNFNIVKDVGGTGNWSNAQGLTISSIHKALEATASDLIASKADFSIVISATGVDASGSTADDYLVQDERQSITFSDHEIEEGRDTIARVECFGLPTRTGECDADECDMIVSATAYLPASDGSSDPELWSIHYTTEKTTPTVGSGEEGERVREERRYNRQLFVSLRFLFAHEMGHVMGLGHPTGSLSKTDTIMLPKITSYMTKDYSVDYSDLSSADKEALRFLYGKR